MVRVQREIRHAAADWSANHSTQATGAAARQNSQHAFFLHKHGADQNDISPIQVGITYGTDIDINQALFPILWQQGCNGQQAQRGKDRFFAFEGKSMLEAPVSIWPLRVHKKRFHKGDPAYLG